MVTGRYVFENATVRSFTRSASSTSLETTIPLFAVGATKLANLNPDEQFSTGSGVLHAAMGKPDGEMVFAAKYQKIDAEYFLVKPEIPFLASSIQLFNALSTQRGGDVEVAKLHVSGKRVDGTTDQQEITEEYWEEFDQAVVNLEEEQEELGTTRARGLFNAF